MKKRTGYNPKRRIIGADNPQEVRIKLADNAKYGGNPEHKTRPNDYGLTPPTNPRPGKTLCDKVAAFPKDEAANLLKQGFLKGMFSVQEHEGWPQNVWAVLDGLPFEAQLENRTQGIYHGYPMPMDDNFRFIVLKEWSRRG